VGIVRTKKTNKFKTNSKASWDCSISKVWTRSKIYVMVTYEIFHLAIYLLVQLFPLADAARQHVAGTSALYVCVRLSCLLLIELLPLFDLSLQPIEGDFDMNLHVNNVKYITWTLEVLYKLPDLFTQIQDLLFSKSIEE
jgi:hypothetical protein